MSPEDHVYLVKSLPFSHDALATAKKALNYKVEKLQNLQSSAPPENILSDRIH